MSILCQTRQPHKQILKNFSGDQRPSETPAHQGVGATTAHNLQTAVQTSCTFQD